MSEEELLESLKKIRHQVNNLSSDNQEIEEALGNLESSIFETIKVIKQHKK